MTNLLLTLDANAFMFLEEDKHDKHLNEVLRRGLDGYYTIAVTSELKEELARDSNVDRRTRNLQKLEKFPEAQVPDNVAIDTLTQELMNEVFPSANPQTGKYKRQWSDCRHLAIHLLTQRTYFITGDTKLLHNLSRLSSKHQIQAGTAETFLREVFYPQIEPVRKPLVLPRLSVRRAKEADYPAICQLLAHMGEHYPNFQSWLEKQFRSTDTIIKVAVANEEAIAGVSISKPKEAGIWKLSTFYVDPAYQGNGLGQHLIFNELQSWLESGINKVVVTTSIDNRELMEFFERVGFVVEGTAPERYPGQVEVVLGRHFVPRTFTPDAFPDLVGVLAGRLFGATVSNATPTEVRCQSSLQGLPIYTSKPPGEIVFKQRKPSAQRFVVDVEMDGAPFTSMDAWDLETKLHPLTVTWQERKAFIIPIHETYANQLFEMQRLQLSLHEEPVTRRLLQMDNVYYCYPRYAGTIVRGTPILFYVTKERNSGSGVAGNLVGMALVQELEVASPEVLYVRHGQRGVYNLDDIEGHQNKRGDAMAIHFSWLRPFTSLVSYNAVKAKIPRWNPQTLGSITHADFLHLCQIGGVRLGNVGAKEQC